MNPCNHDYRVSQDETIFVRSASLWEIAIKISLGKYAFLLSLTGSAHSFRDFRSLYSLHLNTNKRTMALPISLGRRFGKKISLPAWRLHAAEIGW